MPVTVRDAAEADLPLLAAMNRRLIEDEGSRNPMDVAALERRFGQRLRDGWRVVVFDADDRPVGYALYQHRADDYDASKPVVYVRQFYIERDRRRAGLGRQAYAALEGLLPAGCVVELEALETNPVGAAFWRSLGFAPYCTTLKRTAP